MMESARIKSYFDRHGYVVLEQAIEHDWIDAFWREFELLRSSDPLLLYTEFGDIHYGSDLNARQKRRMRAINLHSRSWRARSMATHEAILGAFHAIYAHVPACIQTLAYSQSSRQGAH